LLARLSESVDLSQVKGIAGSGQQHGSVYLDDSFESRLKTLDPTNDLATQIAPALTRTTSPIWMDTSTAAECAEITAALGGPSEVCRRSGSIAIERFTGPQIRRFFKCDPAAYERTNQIHLVSSFIASILAGRPAPIDFGDGAGMNLMNLAKLSWDSELMQATAPGLEKKLPSLAPSTRAFSKISPYFATKYGFSPDCQIAPFTGDNPASLIGMGAGEPGLVVISLGTSDTFFAAMPAGFMSLICFRNGSLAREKLRDQYSLSWSDFDQAALTSTRDAAGLNLMLPFFSPEITPRHDFNAPVLQGSPAFESGANHALQVRALLEGQFLNMRLHSQWMAVTPKRIRLTGGASTNNGIAQIVADVFQAPVERLAIPNSAALGAALIAATAGGHDLKSLQQTFCQSSAGSETKPDPSLAPVYQNALEEFKNLLQRELEN
jgi:xylulokinase